jgi:hypothetical protein
MENGRLQESKQQRYLEYLIEIILLALIFTI